MNNNDIEMLELENRMLRARNERLEAEVANRPWVGLTDEEAAECWSDRPVRTWQAIETKLKEKNT